MTRQHGTGNITELVPNKKYRIRITRGTRADGKPRTICETIHGTRAQAEARAIVLYEQLKTDKSRGSGVTLQDFFLTVFLPKQRKKNRTQANINGYLTAWQHTPDTWKKQAIREPTYNEIEKHLYSKTFRRRDRNGELIEPPEYHAGAAAQWLKYFKAILRDAWKEELLSKQPLKTPHEPPKGNGTARYVWSEAETAAAWLLLRNHRLEAYVLIAGAAGTRREETIALNWQDISFITTNDGITTDITAYITIDKALTEEDGEKGTKTDTSDRVVPVTGYAARRLYEIRKESGAIVTTRTGERLKISGLRRQWENLWNSPADLRFSRSRETRHRKAGLFYGTLERVTINTLRHANITAMMEAGTPDSVNQAYHGHAPRTVETRHYISGYNKSALRAAQATAAAYEDAAGLALHIARLL